MLAVAACGSGGSSAPASGLVAIGAGLHGVRGLHASVYARGPIDLAGFALDRRGHLWMVAAGLDAHPDDGVYELAGPSRTGVRAGVRTAVRVVAGLDDPLGLVWRGSELYVSSVGAVTAYSDLRGDRFADRRVVIRGPIAGGENNGLAVAPDGRLVMGITATCDHCLPRSPYSGSIVSFTPGGGDLRLYATRIRAPVGLAFHDGELFVTMNQRNDLGQRTTGDALAVVAPGTDWRFPGCYQQGGAACAGVPPVIALLDRHAAVGPLVLTGERLSGVPGESALVSEWATGKVIRVALRSHDGDLSAASVSTWLTGARDPFALIGGPGGSLLVGDWATGTIYRIAPLR